MTIQCLRDYHPKKIPPLSCHQTFEKVKSLCLLQRWIQHTAQNANDKRISTKNVMFYCSHLY